MAYWITSVLVLVKFIFWSKTFRPKSRLVELEKMANTYLELEKYFEGSSNGILLYTNTSIWLWFLSLEWIKLIKKYTSKCSLTLYYMIKMQFSKVAMRLPQKGENQWVLFKKKFLNPKAFFKIGSLLKELQRVRTCWCKIKISSLICCQIIFIYCQNIKITT